MSKVPNILITGTPGVGKSVTAERVAQQSGLNLVNVGQLVKDKGLHEGWDEEFQTYTLDDDKVCDELEDQMTAGGQVVDFHTCAVFPERWFDLVVVLRCDNTKLYGRLEKRGYLPNKIQENVECEIMQVVLEEARESYTSEGVVVELKSEEPEDMDANVARICQWIRENSPAAA